jgi:Nif-specific regulatory protein
LVLLSRDGELPGPLVARALAAEAAQSSSTPAPTPAPAPAPAPEPPGAMVATAPAPGSGAQASARTATAMRPYEWVRSEDRGAIEAALQRSGGNRARAARDLGLTPRQLAYRLKVIGIR